MDSLINRKEKIINLTYSNCSFLTPEIVIEEISKILGDKKVKIISRTIKVEELESKKYIHCQFELNKAINSRQKNFVLTKEKKIFAPYVHPKGHPNICK
jgi:rRNA-processing protein FCF1